VALAVAAPALALLVALLQTMRLLPLVAGAGVSAGEAIIVGGLLAILVAAITLPAAAVLAVMAAFARLHGDGELLALEAAGIPPARVAAAPLLLCAAVAAAAGATSLYAEPAAYDALRGRLGALMVRATLGGVRPGVISEPVPGLTVLCRERQGERLEGLFIEDGREEGEATLLFAARGRLRLHEDRPAAVLELEEGALHTRDDAGTLVRARFDRLESALDLEAAWAELGVVVPARLGSTPSDLAAEAREGGADGSRAALLLHRRAAVAPSALGLSVLALLLGLGRRAGGRPWAVAAAAGLVLAFHLTARLAEAWVESGGIGAVLGAWIPTGITWLVAFGWVALGRTRVLCWNHSRGALPA